VSNCPDPIPQGGLARELRIKVGNIVPSCCESNPGGSHADLLNPRRLSTQSCGPRARIRNYTDRKPKENE
jgi:hypothetical protein